MANLAAEAEREKLQEDIQRIQIALRGQGDDHDDDYYDDDDDDDSDILQIDMQHAGDVEPDNQDNEGRSLLHGNHISVHNSSTNVVELQPEFLEDLEVQLDSEELPISTETALALNRAYQEIVCDTLKKIELTLAENRERQMTVQMELDGKAAGHDKEAEGSVKRRPMAQYAVPYLKDVNGNFPPVNSDVLTKKEMREHKQDIRPSAFWTSAQRKTLIEAVRQDSMEKLLRPLMNRKELECEKLLGCKPEEDSEINKRIKQIDKEISEKRNMSTEELLKNAKTEAVDWLKISAMTFHGRRDAVACQMMWQNVLDPSVNRDHWEEEEQEALIALVDKYDMRNWTDVAKELGTNRTPFQCLQYFQRHVNNVSMKREWSEEEDELLAEVVESCRSGTRIPWNQVSYYIEDRSPMQCSNRWNQIDPAVKRGKWSTAEDCALISAVELLGTTDWFRIQEHVPNRTTQQCRERYLNSLDPSLKPKVWSYEEDKELIMRTNMHGTAWAKIAAEMPGRTDNMCLQRYRRLMDWQRKTTLLEQQPAHVKDELLDSHYRMVLGETESTTLTEPMSLKQKPAKRRKEKVPQKSNDEVSWKLLQHQFGIEKEDYLKQKNDRETGDIVVPRPPLLKKYTIRSLQKVWHKREQLQKIIEAQVHRATSQNNLDLKQVAESAETSMESLSAMNKYQWKAVGEALKDKKPCEMTVREILDLSRSVAEGVQHLSHKTKPIKSRKVSTSWDIDKRIQKVLWQKMKVVPKKKKRKGRPRRFDIFAAPDSDEEVEPDSEGKVTTVELLMKALDVDKKAVFERATNQVGKTAEGQPRVPVNDHSQVQHSQSRRRQPTVSEEQSGDEMFSCNSIETDLQLLRTISSSKHQSAGQVVTSNTVQTAPSVPEPVDEEPVRVGKMVSMGCQTDYDINPPKILIARPWPVKPKNIQLPLLPPNVSNLNAFRMMLLHRKKMIETAGDEYNAKFYKSRLKRCKNNENKVDDSADEHASQKCNSKERYKKEVKSALCNVRQEVDRSKTSDTKGKKGKKKSKSTDQVDNLAEIRKSDDFQRLKSRMHAVFVWPALLSTIYPPVTDQWQSRQTASDGQVGADQQGTEDQNQSAKLQKSKTKRRNRGRYPCAHNKKFYQQAARKNDWKEDLKQRKLNSKQNSDPSQVPDVNGKPKKLGRPWGSKNKRQTEKEIPLRRSSRQILRKVTVGIPAEVPFEDDLPKRTWKRVKKICDDPELLQKKLRLDVTQEKVDDRGAEMLENTENTTQASDVISSSATENSSQAADVISPSVTENSSRASDVISLSVTENSSQAADVIPPSVTENYTRAADVIVIPPLVTENSSQAADVISQSVTENPTQAVDVISQSVNEISSQAAEVISPSVVATVQQNGTEQIVSISLEALPSNSQGINSIQSKEVIIPLSVDSSQMTKTVTSESITTTDMQDFPDQV